MNPVQVQRGILKAAEVAADAITAQSKKVKGREDYKRIATISANGDEHIGNLMADAMEKVGKEGVITVDEGKSTESPSNTPRACSSTRVISRPIS